jgi:hypothetical protein
MFLVTCFVQFGMSQKLAEVEIKRIWNSSKEIDSKHGLVEDWALGDDTARYFLPKPGLRSRTFIYDPNLPLPWNEVTPPIDIVTTKVDGSKAKFGAGWYFGPTNVATTPGWHDNTIAFANAPGSTVTYTFSGTKIELWAEILPTHGTGTVKIDNGAETKVSFNGAKQLPALIYSSPILPAGTHTITLKVTSGYNLLDFFVIHNPGNTQGNNDPPPIPEVGIINVTPSQNIKQAIETASAKTIKFSDGIYNLENIFVPAGVNIDLGTATINAITHGNFNEQKAVFHFNSGSRADGNQYIQGGTINGKNIAACGIIVNNRNNVHIRNVNLQDFKFVGVWVQNASGGSIGPAKLSNTSGATNSWASGEVCFTNISNYDIHDIHVSSNASNRGYGFKALYNNGSIGPNVQFRNLTTAMNHSSIWNGGQSRNIGFELSETKIISPVEIHNNTFGNQVSLAIGYQDQGELIVRDNIFDTGGDTYAIETLLDNLKFYNNTIRNTQMMFANFQTNKKWKNWVVYNNRFESSPGVPSWGGIFLIGGAGVDNVRIYNNIISQPAGSALVRYMGVTGGVTVQ